MSAHAHAENMRLYAEDAAETDKPWERWEYRVFDGHPWYSHPDNPMWNVHWEYRRKPKTVTIGGVGFTEQDIDEACAALVNCGREDIADALCVEFNK